MWKTSQDCISVYMFWYKCSGPLNDLLIAFGASWRFIYMSDWTWGSGDGLMEFLFMENWLKCNLHFSPKKKLSLYLTHWMHWLFCWPSKLLVLVLTNISNILGIWNKWIAHLILMYNLVLNQSYVLFLIFFLSFHTTSFNCSVKCYNNT